MIGGIIIVWQRKKINQLRKIEDLEKDLDERKNELRNLQEELAERSKELEEKEKKLKRINSDIDELQFKKNFLLKYKESGAPESALAELEEFVRSKDPQFYERMRELESDLRLDKEDFHDTLLIRLGIKTTDRGRLIGFSYSKLQMRYVRRLEKVADRRGCDRWDEYIRSFIFSDI